MAELARITRVKPGRVVKPISAQAKITRTSAGRYELSLRTQREDQTGDTDLDAPACPVLKRGVTLVLALALGDGVDLIDDKASTALAPPERAAPAPARARPHQRESAETLTSPMRLAPWLAATGAWGFIGKPSFGGQFGLTAGQTHWEALGRASLWPRQSAARVAGVDASFSAIVGALGVCGREPIGAWSLSGCATFELGAIHGSSSGAFRDGSATAPYYAVGPSVVLTMPLYGPATLRFEAGLGVALNPPHFVIASFREVYAVERFVPALSLGLAFEPSRAGSR